MIVAQVPRYVYIQRCEIYIYRIPIPFINELDTKALPPLHYTTKRICYPGVNINTNNEHMICCDCTDNCQDKTKCACCLLTAEVSRYKDFYGYVVVIIVVVVVIVIIIIVIVIVVIVVIVVVIVIIIIVIVIVVIVVVVVVVVIVIIIIVIVIVVVAIVVIVIVIIIIVIVIVVVAIVVIVIVIVVVIVVVIVIVVVYYPQVPKQTSHQQLWCRYL